MQAYWSVHDGALRGIRRSWVVVASAVLALLALGVLLRGTFWPLLGHALFTPLLLYVAVRGEVMPRHREAHDIAVECMQVIAFNIVLYLFCIIVGVALFLFMSGLIGFLIGGVISAQVYIVLILPVLSWFVALLILGPVLPAIAMDEWDEGLGEVLRTGKRQRRWLIAQVSAGPLPVFGASLVVAVSSGLWAFNSEVPPLSPERAAAVSLLVLSIQAYAIWMTGIVLSLAFLRDRDLTRDTVNVFS